MNLLVTICARSGSKGVKDKNIRPLLGMPLIAHTIKQARQWGRVTHCVVSTDSEKIAETAKEFGADVPFLRPVELARDTTPKIEAIRHALVKSECFFKTQFPIV